MEASMHRLALLLIMLALQVTAAAAQSPTANADGLSMEQQPKVGEILTKDGGAPLHGGNFSLAMLSFDRSPCL
jgi:hypothetical protein